MLGGAVPAFIALSSGRNRSIGPGRRSSSWLGGDLGERLEEAELERIGSFAMIAAASDEPLAAWNSPRRRSPWRGARAPPPPGWAMARRISSGRSMCLTATCTTLMPHGSVCWSMIAWRLLVDLLALGQQLVQLGLAADAPQRRLRDLRGGEKIVLDLDDGAVRVDHAEVETAFTLTETLSLVMTSCAGTSIVMVRRSMRTMPSRGAGGRRARPVPGPPELNGEPRPRRKMTARSYSRSTRAIEERKNSRDADAEEPELRTPG